MILDNIKRFVKLAKKGNIIYFDTNYKISFPDEDYLNYPYELGENEVIMSFQNNIYIVYDKETTLVECFFDMEPDYVQSEYYLNDFSKNTGYTDYCYQYIKSSPNILLTNCLILGLGIGNIPNLLIQKFNDKINIIDCVDINKILCVIYKLFFNVSNKIKIYNEKAEDFIENTKKIYDYVFIDIPCFIVNKKFMDNIKKIITKKCFIQINLIGSGIEDIVPEELFNDFTIIESKIIDENNIFFLANK